MTRPAERPMDHQRRAVREQLHTLVDRICDAWPRIQELEREMARGYPVGQENVGSSSTVSNPTLSAALNRDDAAEWLTHFSEWTKQTIDLDADRARLARKDLPTKASQTELCAECNGPIKWKIKRLDGQPYHHPETSESDNGCWWKAYNRTRGRRENAWAEVRVQPDESAGH